MSQCFASQDQDLNCCTQELQGLAKTEQHVEPIRSTKLTLKVHSHHKPSDVLLIYTLAQQPHLLPILLFCLCALLY
ncbi:hypothetical protein MJO28_010440 [Puccinia striiformis f. sp. tritici]|uniref:Uncharacterized protein n=1 Tax=Puccinia striiformis f. sp. tritici TaxID=168172 RepID=A0ACC0E4H1_9BASI|nr:hypothetical protein MJO28_010440 [Puccinia striiformis f. sp. tritici]